MIIYESQRKSEQLLNYISSYIPMMRDSVTDCLDWCPRHVIREIFHPRKFQRIRFMKSRGKN